MDERVQRILEYDKITKQVASFAKSERGAELCCALCPSSEADTIDEWLSLTNCADALWTRTGQNPLQSFEPCGEWLARCAAGGIPSAGELLSGARMLRAIRQVKERLVQGEVQPPLSFYEEQLIPYQQVEQEIFRCILSEEEIADEASVELRTIRRQIKAASERVRAKLQEIIASSTMKPLLQDALITMRNGRYVVPVKAEHAGAVSGLEHDRSASGATVFIEPLSVLQANNQLREAQAAERSEIQRILQRLGALIGVHRHDIELSTQALCVLDVQFAKAGWGRAHSAVQPVMGEGEQLALRGARHPLIAREQVVPIDVAVGGETKALIITGPNTGGKTVTLKTAGLFVLLAQSGLFLPCQKASVPVYRAVFADIGDEQSIEQSLSTFSSHMVNLVDILQRAKERTLVLVDELGVGTDPSQGAALAIAILQTLSEQGATIIATTHYGELKAFAMSQPGFVNAGMEFDLQSLKPTYRLMTGFAGSSNAFEISRRLGLSDEVIERAKQQVSEESMRLETAIESAQDLRVQAQREREENQAYLAEQRAAWEQELDALRESARKSEQRAQQRYDQARATLEAAQQETQDAIEAARLAAREENAKQREALLQQARDGQKRLSELKDTLPAREVVSPGQPLTKVTVGQSVFVATLNANATVLALPDGKGDVLVQAGIVKVAVPLNALRAGKGVSKKMHGGMRVVRTDAPQSLKNEVDVRGMMVEEACMAIDMHLDSAVMDGLLVCHIIHGKGTGALRNGIRSYLRRHPHVRTLRPGLYGEGEDGVTVVELK